MKISIFILMCTTMIMAGCSAPDMEQQIDELYGKMSQEERIATSRDSWILQSVVN